MGFAVLGFTAGFSLELTFALLLKVRSPHGA